MCKAIYFDMDGTIADLYGVENWEYKLRSFDPTPYKEAQPLVDMDALVDVCSQLIALGITIGVISWLSKDSTKEYDKQVRAAKREWLRQNFPCVSEYHLVKYGTPKHYVRNVKESILVDDNDDVCAKWNGNTIDAKQDIIKELQKILDNTKAA